MLERSRELKLALTDFVLDAEGELAEALETFAAQKSRRSAGGSVPQDLILDIFLTEGNVGDKTPIDLFLAEPDLSQSDRKLLSNFRSTFTGLFAVTQILPDGFELMNWLTAKRYIVKTDNAQSLKEMARFKEGEILLTRIAPVTDTYWMFFSKFAAMGNLGKPKLAVAIGNFKENHKDELYSDAPDLLELAWQSVEQYHQHFVDFFGSSEVILPGYQLNKRIAEFQEAIAQAKLEQAGVDTSKSLAEMAQEAGVEEEEIKAAAEKAGADAKVVSQILEGKNASKMAMPKVELPAELKKAEQVTAISHPRWGQMFLPTYGQFKALLEAEDWQSVEGAEKLVRHYLVSPMINAFIWQKLANEYQTQLEKVLQTFLKRPDFQLERDLASLLQEFGKPIEPELPEIASVPLHLDKLFQEALAEVNKSQSKSKEKRKTAFGFQKS